MDHIDKAYRLLVQDVTAVKNNLAGSKNVITSSNTAYGYFGFQDRRMTEKKRRERNGTTMNLAAY